MRGITKPRGTHTRERETEKKDLDETNGGNKEREDIQSPPEGRQPPSEGTHVQR